MEWRSFYWVQENRLMAGNYPWSEVPEEANFKLSVLKSKGIDAVVSLIEADELSTASKKLLSYADAMQAAGIEVINIPIRDFSIPSVEQMQKILTTIDILIAQKKIVYIHCRGGIGRTGTAVGCWLIQKKIASPANVLEQIRQLKSESGLSVFESPETEEQRNFILNWVAQVNLYQPKIVIRPASPDDFESILKLIKELATYEKAPEAVTNNLELMHKEQDYFRALVVENEKAEIIAFALYFFAYYTWVGKSLYLDDLYVKEEYRNSGIGKDLLRELTFIARKENCKRFRWQVLEWNTPAIRFYEKMGASISGEWLNCDLI
jgi:protein-tyrosine phosphatase/GNAT superfamily N-acetyltransferase